MWLYTDFNNNAKWAKDMNGYRATTKHCARIIVRVAHIGVSTPQGYHKPNGELAFNAIEKLPTMRSLIHALTK